jgi:hypothetical protein
VLTVGLCAATVPAAVSASSPAGAPLAAAALAATAWADADLGGLHSEVLNLALRAASCAVRSGDISHPQTLTVIDYSRPSTAKRLWVLDLENRELLYEELVAHGEGSGDNLATRFSNEAETHRTSLGLFKTNETYLGKHGYSLRLDGLDTGFNDRARERAIVIHGASYVSDTFARKAGRLGRSWGCPALSDGIARAVIDIVKGSGLVFAYYPDPNWLARSKYLGGCPPA